jgi:hypothetical protein
MIAIVQLCEKWRADGEQTYPGEDESWAEP